MNQYPKPYVFCAYYMSKFDLEGAKKLGFSSRRQAFSSFSKDLNCKFASITLTRDHFDPLTNSHRQGYDKNIYPIYKAFNETFQDVLIEEFSMIIISICEQAKISSFYGDQLSPDTIELIRLILSEEFIIDNKTEKSLLTFIKSKLDAKKIARMIHPKAATFVTVSPQQKGHKNKSSVDYDELQRKKTRLGNFGEEIIFEYEKKKLADIGRVDLSKKVERVSDHGGYLGYDVLSFFENGNEKHIEVKSTFGNIKDLVSFYLTDNELAHLKTENSYYIYYLSNLINPDDLQFFILTPKDVDKESIKPVLYKVKLRAKMI